MRNFYLKAFRLISASAHLAKTAATFSLLSLLFTASLQAQDLKYVNGLIRPLPIGGAVTGTNITVDAAGSTYIIGSFQGTVDFDPGAGVVNLTSNGAFGNSDIFIAKYDASGNYVYAKSIGRASGSSIAVDASGSVYITGLFSGTVDFDPGAGTISLTSAGGSDIFIAKYDASGNYVYAKSMGGIDNEGGSSIVVDASGNIYINGYFGSTADFDPGAGTVNLTSAGSSDVFIAKYDASGNYIYAKGMGGTGIDYGNSIAVDAAGNVYITGYFGGTADFDPGAGTANLTSASAGNPDIFIAKYDALGNYVYAKGMGGTGTDYGNSIAVDATGNVYITGYFNQTADFDPGAATAILTSADMFSSDIFIAKYDAAGNYVYAKGIGGTSFDVGNSIVVDALSNAYITGFFKGIADFDPGAGTANLTSASAGAYDIFIAKYDAAGNYVYARSMGGTSDDAGNSIAVDVSGNAYSTGYFTGTADFDPGAGTANLTSAGGRNSFVAKLNSAGNYLWAIQQRTYNADAALSNLGNSVTVDAAGNAYSTGYFYGTVDFDPGAGTANLTSNGGSDIFIAKYDAAGNYVWAKAIGGTSGDVGNDIAVDASGNVYITGSFNGIVDFDPGAGTINLTSAGGYDIFIAKYDAAGNYVYAKGMGSTSDEGGGSIAVDAAGNVYITGSFEGTADFDPGAGVVNLTSAGFDDIFIAKYDALGNYIYAKSMGGIDNEGGRSIAVDASGNVYITGSFQRTADFDPGAGVVNLTSAYMFSTDVFIAKYDAAGNYIYAKSIGGTGFDFSNGNAIDASGNVYITGSFQGTADFDPGAGVANLTSAGGYDIFIAKYDASGNYVYAKGIGARGFGSGSIAIEAAGNVYITGNFTGTVDFDPGAGTVNITSNGNADIFIAKYDAAGNYVYAKGMGGTSDDVAYGIAADASGNTYVTGFFQGTADFDPGGGSPNSVITTYNGSDIFLAKYGAAGVLPVRLLSFTATPAADGASVLVNWQTTVEINNHHFEVQRSTNGVAFQTIGQQPACSNCSALQPYSFTDNRPYNGLSYYRLKQVDVDGSAAYSKIVTVNIGGEHQSSVLLYPNITDAAFTVWIKGNTVERQVALNIVTASGSMVKKQTVWLHKGDNKIDMNIGGQASGLYYVQIADAANNSTSVLKVIKQ